jgi:hypothetical protein
VDCVASFVDRKNQQLMFLLKISTFFSTWENRCNKEIFLSEIFWASLERENGKEIYRRNQDGGKRRKVKINK